MVAVFCLHVHIRKNNVKKWRISKKNYFSFLFYSLTTNISCVRNIIEWILIKAMRSTKWLYFLENLSNILFYVMADILNNLSEYLHFFLHLILGVIQPSINHKKKRRYETKSIMTLIITNTSHLRMVRLWNVFSNISSRCCNNLIKFTKKYLWILRFVANSNVKVFLKLIFRFNDWTIQNQLTYIWYALTCISTYGI